MKRPLAWLGLPRAAHVRLPRISLKLLLLINALYIYSQIIITRNSPVSPTYFSSCFFAVPQHITNSSVLYRVLYLPLPALQRAVHVRLQWDSLTAFLIPHCVKSLTSPYCISSFAAPQTYQHSSALFWILIFLYWPSSSARRYTEPRPRFLSLPREHYVNWLRWLVTHLYTLQSLISICWFSFLHEGDAELGQDITSFTYLLLAYLSQYRYSSRRKDQCRNWMPHHSEYQVQHSKNPSWSRQRNSRTWL